MIAEQVMKILSVMAIGSIGSTADWRLGCGALIDAPDRQIAIVDSPGQAPDPKWLLDYPFFQVLVRGRENDYQTAKNKMQDIYDALLGLPPAQVSNGRIDGITMLSSPAFIGPDKLERPVFSANFRCIFEPDPTPLTNREPLEGGSPSMMAANLAFL